MMCSDLCAFVAMFMCVIYVSMGSSVPPNMFGWVFMGSDVLSICRCSLVINSAGFSFFWRVWMLW